MQPSRSLDLAGEAVWGPMEETLTEVRRRWFDAQVERLPVGTLISERQGELLVWGEATGEQTAAWLGWALRRRAYVVETAMSRPRDLALRLRQVGYRLAQAQGTYLYLPGGTRELQPRPARSLLGWLRQRRAPAEVRMEEIDALSLATWNRVCWQAFGSRGASEQESLQEKRRAFFNLAGSAHWYLAFVEGQPVGTTILFEGEHAGQILAVGTLASVRRRGVASALVRHAVAEHTGRYRTPLFLDTQPGSGAEQLYLSLGFVQAYLRQTYAPPPLP